MKLKVSKESASGLNTEFVNVETGRRIVNVKSCASP